MEGLDFKNLPVQWTETCINKKSQCQQVLRKSDHVLSELRGDTNSFLDNLEGHTLEVTSELNRER